MRWCIGGRKVAAMPWDWPFEQTDEHVGGYPLCAVVMKHGEHETLFKDRLRPDTAIQLARSVWKNNQPLDEVWVVNQKTGSRSDVISGCF